MVVAECWLQDYKVSLFNSPEAMLKMPARNITPADIKIFTSGWKQAQKMPRQRQG
jgi:hypothetical protein